MGLLLAVPHAAPDMVDRPTIPAHYLSHLNAIMNRGSSGAATTAPARTDHLALVYLWIFHRNGSAVRQGPVDQEEERRRLRCNLEAVAANVVPTTPLTALVFTLPDVPDDIHNTTYHDAKEPSGFASAPLMLNKCETAEVSHFQCIQCVHSYIYTYLCIITVRSADMCGMCGATELYVSGCSWSCRWHKHIQCAARVTHVLQHAQAAIHCLISLHTV